MSVSCAPQSFIGSQVDVDNSRLRRHLSESETSRKEQTDHLVRRRGDRIEDHDSEHGEWWSEQRFACATASRSLRPLWPDFPLPWPTINSIRNKRRTVQRSFVQSCWQCGMLRLTESTFTALRASWFITCSYIHAHLVIKWMTERFTWSEWGWDPLSWLISEG